MEEAAASLRLTRGLAAASGTADSETDQVVVGDQAQVVEVDVLVARAGEPVVTGVAGERDERGYQDEDEDQSGHGSNHASIDILPGVAVMP